MLHLLDVGSFEKVQHVDWDQGAREQISEWLQAIITDRNISAIQLGKLSGVSPTTIYRALDTSSEFTPTIKTLQKIAAKTGRTLPNQGYLEVHHIEPFNEAAGAELVDLPRHMVALSAEEHRKFAYRMLDRSLELEGYLPGDIVIVDEDVTPKVGDIICAKVLNNKNSGPILRLFEPPYLISRSLDRRIEPAPILMDRNVEIKGTATAMIREMRRAS